MCHLSSDGIVDGLDLLVSFVEEKLCWKNLRWLNRDDFQGGDAGLPANPSRFDLPRSIYLRGMCSFRDLYSPCQTWTGEWRRERWGVPWTPPPSCRVVLTCP